MKVYTGAPAAARAYLEADRGRADDYYLAEGTGMARRYASAHDRVEELAPLTGEAYEAWVAGRDPVTGEPRGQLRSDERAVRFVEVVVNGPKSWSLAAALHPDIAAAYDAAQDRAASQIIGWLAQHATTRVGPRGGQVQVPVEVLEAVTVRHYTSRTGDPHRHLHLQILARVFGAGKWRGLHTVGLRDSLNAINGIGHAAVATDPHLRAAFAAQGYTLDSTGEIRQLADYVGPFSARAAQIARNVDRYEREWTAAHPGDQPGPALRRAWDARAWAEGRPYKVAPRPGANLDDRWRSGLADLGYQDPERPAHLTSSPVGALDRDGAAERVLTRLAAGRSAWNPADIRGEVERLIAGEGIVVEAAVRIELAEDLTARAVQRCVPLLSGDGVPEHIRAWTSRPVLDVEADLTARLSARGRPGPEHDLAPASAVPRERLDTGQAAAVTGLAGDRPLVVLEGAAGAGKTTTLAVARALLDEQGRRLIMVTPTLKAAKVAQAAVGASAGSAAWLAFQHGWRWSDEGAWSRLAVGQPDPLTGVGYQGPAESGRLRPGDLLVVDEAGMLDQDTARALLTVADECRARVALVGDRHQLPAVGRGGVLDLAARAVDPAGHLTLDEVHRFTRTDATGRHMPDRSYAELTLAMRRGDDPGAVFDSLVARDQIQLHTDPAALRQALAATAADHYRRGHDVAVMVDIREEAAELNAAIRERRVAEGSVEDTKVVTTLSGQWIGAGDRVATRRNDRDLDVANRDTWTVTAVGRHGALVVTAAGTGARVLPAEYVASHVELAYATTAYGAQGDTVTAGHVVIGEHTGSASAYVGMTRGRESNVAHLVAADVTEAREQWIVVFGRDRADLGPRHAAGLAAREAARYATPRPLDQVLAQLCAAWTAEQGCLDRLAVVERMRDALRDVARPRSGDAARPAALAADYRRAAAAAEQAAHRAESSGTAIAEEVDQIRDALLRRWDGERAAAQAAAKTVLDGPGWLGLRRAAVARARDELADWADRWRAQLPHLPTEVGQIARVAGWFDDRPALWTAFVASARRAAEQSHPEHPALCAAAAAAHEDHERARRALAEAGSGPDARLAELDRAITASRQQLAVAQARIAQLEAEPAISTRPPERLAQERDAWRERRDADRRQRRAAGVHPTTAAPGVPRPQPTYHRLSAGHLGAAPPPGR